MTFAQKFTLLVQYFEFDSPAGAFSTARSINANLTYDDSSLLGAFALHPHFTVLYELGAPGFAGLTRTAGTTSSASLPAIPSCRRPPTRSPLPFRLRLAWVIPADSTATITSVISPLGRAFSVPLAFIPSGFGSWTATRCLYLYYDGTTVREANALAGVAAAPIAATSSPARSAARSSLYRINGWFLRPLAGGTTGVRQVPPSLDRRVLPLVPLVIPSTIVPECRDLNCSIQQSIRLVPTHAQSNDNQSTPFRYTRSF